MPSRGRLLFVASLLVAAARGARYGGRHWAAPDSGDGGRGGAVHDLASAPQAVRLSRRRALSSISVFMLSAGAAGAMPKLNEATSEAVFRSMDTDEDGFLDRQEYLLGTRDMLDEHDVDDKAFRSKVYEFVGALYDVADIDGDGVLSPMEYFFSELISGGNVREAVAQGVPVSGKLQLSTLEYGTRTAEKLHRDVDVDKSGFVDWAEFWAATRRTFDTWGFGTGGLGDERLTEETYKLFDKANVDRVGGLSSQELQFAGLMITDFMVHYTTQSIVEELDVNSDGQIEMAEINERIKGYSRHEPASKEVAEAFRDNFGDADIDGDGMLDAEEAAGIASWLLYTRRQLRASLAA